MENTAQEDTRANTCSIASIRVLPMTCGDVSEHFGQIAFIRCIRVFTTHAHDNENDVLHNITSSLTVNAITVC